MAKVIEQQDAAPVAAPAAPSPPAAEAPAVTPPASFGEPIVAGDSPGLPDGAPAIAPAPGEPGPGQGGPEAPPTFLDTKWPIDAKLPEGMEKYTTPQALITAHEDAQKKITSQGQELGTLRSDMKALREGKQTDAMADLRERAEKEIGEGGMSRDTIAAFAQSSGLSETMVSAFSQFMVKATADFNAKAELILGGKENLDRFYDELAGGKFSAEQLNTWNGQATQGDTSWLNFVAPQLGFTIDPAAVQPAQTAPVDGSPNEPSPGQNRIFQQVPVGAPPAPPAPDVFETRNEYLAALQKAEDHYNTTSDPSQRVEVRAKLDRSDINSWGDQVGG